MTIIIETPTTTRERLVLMPPDAVSRTEGGDELLTIRTANARDATPADLERAGYVRDDDTRAGLRDALRARERAELDALAELDEQRARAEKAERERDEALLRAHTGVVHYEILRQSGEEAARQRDEARAELARLTAPGEGEPTVSWFYDTYCARFESTQQEDCADAYRLGVAHERARHVEKDRATDEELGRVFGEAYTVEESPDHGVALRTAYLAVAARVRQERCLVAQAVAANVDIRVCEDVTAPDPRPYGGGFMIGVHAPGCDEELVRCVPVAEVPTTLARLLGEVSRG